jgi:hypothetical protein
MAVAQNTNTEDYHVGDRVYADFERSGRFHEATIQNIHNSLFCHVQYATGEKERVLVQSLQTYRPIVQGDAVEVDIEDEMFLATVTKVHPLGTYDLLYDDGEDDLYVARELFQLTNRDEDDTVPISLSTTTTAAPKVGQRMRGNFQGQGEWFDGMIARVNSDGTYAVDYMDGDKESAVPRDWILLITRER